MIEVLKRCKKKYFYKYQNNFGDVDIEGLVLKKKKERKKKKMS